MIDIDYSWTRRLLELPETGMGYQVVALEVAVGDVEPVFILDGRFALEGIPGEWFLSLRKRSSIGRIESALTQSLGERSVQILRSADLRSHGPIEKRLIQRGGGPADEAPPESSKSAEMFLRFSAFANDRRVLEDGSVLPGTYVTTYADGLTVATGAEAVRRYALPNPDPAVHRFHLNPPRPVQVRRGTVQPANGQPGGGIEVILDGGAPSGTCFNRDDIPPD